MKWILKTAFIFLLLVSAQNARASGTTKWVDLSGVSQGTGTSVNDLCTGISDKDCTPSAGDTVQLCNATTAGITAATLTSGSTNNPITYSFACPGGIPGSSRTTGSVVAMTLGSKQWLIIDEPNLSNSGTADCMGSTGIQNVVVRGNGTCVNCGKEDAVWTNNDENGVIGPCGSNGFSISNSNADNVTFSGLHWHDSVSHMFDTNPTSAISLDNFLISDSFFDTCGTRATTHCIYPFITAGSGATYINYHISNVFIKHAQNAGIRMAGKTGEHTPTFINPIIEDVTCYECGYAHETGSDILVQDALNPIVRRIAGVSSGNDGGVFTYFYTKNSLVEDVRCLNTTLVLGQTNGSFCVDIDLGNDGVTARRIFDLNNTGRKEASGCVSANSCSGDTIAVIRSMNVNVSSVVSVNARICAYISDPPQASTVLNNVILTNFTCVNTIDNGIYVQSNVDPNALSVYNSTFSGIGGSGIKNTGGEMTNDYNNFYNNTNAVSKLLAMEPLTQDPIDFTNNSWYPDGRVWWSKTGGSYDTLALAYAHIPATTPVFSGSTKRHERDQILPTGNPWKTPVTLGSDYKTEVTTKYVPTLASGSTAKNSGVVIQNITDGYSGSAPDRGAVIAGRSLPVWGDRTGTLVPLTFTPSTKPTSVPLTTAQTKLDFLQDLLTQLKALQAELKKLKE